MIIDKDHFLPFVSGGPRKILRYKKLIEVKKLRQREIQGIFST